MVKMAVIDFSSGGPRSC